MSRDLLVDKYSIYQQVIFIVRASTVPTTMSASRENTHNFAAGPSPLPTSVLEEAAKGLLNYNGTGMGICELSHRGKEFKSILDGAEGE